MVDGAGNGLTYQHLQVSADKLLPFDGGNLSPEVIIGGSRVGVAGDNVYHVSTAYAGFGASYSYPIGRYVSLDGSAAIGRDFATHVTGLHMVGGLFYQAGAEVDFSGVGPGLFSVGYEYRHLPISCIPQYPHEHQWLSGAVQHHFLVLCHIPQDAAPARGTSRWRKVLVFGALIPANPFVAWFSEDLPSAEIFSSIKRPQTLYWVRRSVKPPTPFANG
ncbi:MAG: hypothetical protein M0003_03810 [Acidithiobacillus sp.]|nr:hypothetical protein [Acidithiobacillus sp.]